MKAAFFMPPKGLLACVPMGGALLAMFFLPWMKLSCDPKAFFQQAEIRVSGQAPQNLPEKVELASATGLQMAAGKVELAPDGKSKLEKASEQEREQFQPKRRPWLYACLAMPILMLLAGVLGVARGLSRHGAGQLILLAAFLGFVCMLFAASVNYVDDLTDQAMAEMPQGFAANAGNARGLQKAREKMKDVVQTRATVYFWVSLGLYVAVGGCALGVLRKPAPRPSDSRTAAAARPAVDDGGPSMGPHIFRPPPQGVSEFNRRVDSPEAPAKSLRR